MAEMTDEEAEYWDELYTRTTPKIDTSKPGYYTTHIAPLLKAEAESKGDIKLDEATIRIIKAKAEAARQTPAELIGELVRKDLALAE